jgi:hypothetical protein
MKSFYLKFISVIGMMILIATLSASPSFASGSVGKKRMTKKDVAAMRETKKLNRKIKKARYIKKAPKWKKWKKSTDQKYFH